MSTIKVNKIENTATADGGIAIDASGHVTVDGQQLPSAGPLSHRNLLVNGGMTVAQRSTSETGVTSSGIYTVDRWKLDTTDEATYTIEQSTDSPEGFKNSLKFTVTTADGTVAADDYAACHYLLEGNDTVPLGFGASGAKSFTLSFYVKSSQTGTFGLSFQNSDNSRNFDSSYSISTADTWERKTITIPGDTSGTWLTNNGTGIKIWWSFLVGSTYEASAVSTAWGTSVKLGLNGQVQLSSISNATWQITGVQLEVGDKATPFEHRSYGDELARCQRYFYAHNCADTYNMVAHGHYGSSTLFIGLHAAPVPFRAVPSLTTSGSFEVAGDSASQDVTAISISDIASGNTTLQVRATLSGGLSGEGSFLRNKNDATAKFELSAEL